MLANIINASDIIKGNLTISINIKLLVCLSNETESVLVEISTKGSEELIKVYVTIAVAIEMANEYLDLLV